VSRVASFTPQSPSCRQFPQLRLVLWDAESISISINFLSLVNQLHCIPPSAALTVKVPFHSQPIARAIVPARQYKPIILTMSTPKRLANKTAIITGSSSGIGRATALLFAQQGANVVCSDIRPDARTERSESSTLTTVEEIEKLGGRAIFVKCDTSSSSDVSALVQKAVAEFGRLDIMVNNAGVAFDSADPRPIWEYPDDRWDKTIAVNLTGVFLGCKFAAKQMKDQEPGEGGDRGWIVNIASVLGIGGTPSSCEWTLR
jgi:hypothetical protein